MIPWEALVRDMPRISADLTRMMVEEALPAIISGPVDGLGATPAVSIEYKMRDGSGSFRVELSVDVVRP